VKKLGRIHGGAGKRITGIKRNPRKTHVDQDGVNRKVIGWECVHVAIDDATRLAYAEVLPNEKAATAIGILRRAIAFYERHGMNVQELITDNGAPYRWAVHAIACRTIGIRTYAPGPTGPRPTGRQSGSSGHARRLSLRSDLPQQQRTHSSP
jgi:hypothetical protein